MVICYILFSLYRTFPDRGKRQLIVSLFCAMTTRSLYSTFREVFYRSGTYCIRLALQEASVRLRIARINSAKLLKS
jgi:hypothetical protein